MLQVNVSLPSGRHESFSLSESSKVGDLKGLAQKYFGQGFLKLVTANGSVLTDPIKSLHAAGIQDGDHLTVAQPAKVKGARHAFAMWCCGDGMVTWGNPASWLTDRS